jgi:predicted transcriptional regulator YheO
MTTKTIAAAAPRRKRTPRLAPAIQAERNTVLNALHPIVEMLGAIIGPHIEVVLHDLTQPANSVAAIANGHVSNRAVGSSILTGPKNDIGFASAKRELVARGAPRHTIVHDYPTTTSGGQPLKSATVIFRDAGGDPFAALCLNADLAPFHMAHAFLERLLQPKPEAEPARDDAPQMDTLMKEIISDAVPHFRLPVESMSREDKILAVQEMLQRGLFIVKGGVARAAAALHVSRFTIYNYLEELKRRGAVGPEHGGAARKATSTTRRAIKPA